MKKTIIILSSFVFYCLVFYLTMITISSNDLIIGFLRYVNNLIIPIPQYLSIGDSIKSILPSIYFINSLFCLLFFLISYKLISANRLKRLKLCLVKISLFVFFILLINYLFSFHTNNQIYNSYQEEKQIK
jgi:hypothetical protein